MTTSNVSFLRGSNTGERDVTASPLHDVTRMAYTTPEPHGRTDHRLPSPTAEPDPDYCYMNTSYTMHNTQSQLPVNGNDVVTSIHCYNRYVWSFFRSATAFRGPKPRQASRSHSDTPQSVGPLWTSDQLVTETSTWQNTTLTGDRHPCLRRDSNPQSRQASGHRPTP